MRIKISFMDSNNSDASWEGITDRKLRLKMGCEALVHIAYVVVKPGIYNLAREIKYDINDGSEELRHSEYEQLYLTVRGERGN